MVYERARNAMHLVASIPSYFGRPKATLPDTPAIVVEEVLQDGKGLTSPAPKRERSEKAGAKHNPYEYERARRRLNKALLEHYRGLEALNNFRVRFEFPRVIGGIPAADIKRGNRSSM